MACEVRESHRMGVEGFMKLWENEDEKGEDMKKSYYNNDDNNNITNTTS